MGPKIIRRRGERLRSTLISRRTPERCLRCIFGLAIAGRGHDVPVGQLFSGANLRLRDWAQAGGLGLSTGKERG
jgi:hypothetical protein